MVCERIHGLPEPQNGPAFAQLLASVTSLHFLVVKFIAGSGAEFRRILTIFWHLDSPAPLNDRTIR